MNEQALLQDVRRYLAVFHKRRNLIVACVVSGLVVAGIYSYTTRPLYQATASIQIDRDAPNVLTAREVVDLGQAGLDYFQTQYQILRGRTLSERVVEQIGFQKNAELKTGPLMSPVERIQVRFFGKTPKALVDKDGVLLSPAVAAFRSRLKVEPVSGTRLVNLRFSAYDPDLAALAVNTLAEVYIDHIRNYRFETSSEATGWLGERLKEEKKKVEDAERALQAYREREGLVNIEERQGLVDQKLTALTAAVVNARTERITKETLFEQMRSLSTAQLEAFPLVMANGVVQSLKTELASLQREQTRLSETYGERHPDMLRVRSQIRATEEKIRAEIADVVKSVENAYQTARQQESNLQASLDALKHDALDVNRRSIEYGVLKREVDSNQQLFRDLLNRSKETGLESELRSTNVRINEKAERGVLIAPRRGMNLGVGLLVGFVLGVGLTLLFEHLDNTLKTPEDVKQHLGLPFLGVVPDVGARASEKNVPKPSPLILRNPKSAVAEAYRVLRTNLIFSSAESAGRVIVVTSANPGEGKTTTTVNLAASLAQTSARVLAVEADLRRPSMSQHFGVDKAPGLTDLIVGKTEATEAIHTTRYKGLMVLPCGYVPPNPAELLGSARMKDVLRALRSHYDWVIIDTPPVLAMADTPVLCPVVDGIVLVVAAESSGRPAVLRAIDQITSVGGKLIGVVLNKVDLERNAYYYGQYYGEYYRSYYAEGASRRQGGRAESGASDRAGRSS
jgi:capsular exopolysaccharide synthesis family protein